MNILFADSIKQEIIDQILIEVKILKKEEKNHLTASQNTIYKMDLEKVGNKKFVSRPLMFTQKKQEAIKRLFKEYLQLKITENNIEHEMFKLDLCKKTKRSIFRFKINVDDSISHWFELSGEKYRDRYSILSFKRDNQREYRTLSRHENLLFQKGILMRIFNGNQLESIKNRKIKKKDNSFWAGWKTSMGAFSGTIRYLPFFFQHCIYSIGEKFSTPSSAWKEYQYVIHPALSQVSCELLKNCPKNPKIVEICGGEGELAKKIAEKYLNQMTYYLLEYNDRALYIARKRLSKQKGIIPIKTDVTNIYDYFTDNKKQSPIPNNSIDLIIGSGALTVCVFESKKTAIKIAKKCYDLLKPGGKLVLAGHAHSLLNTQDFNLIGFNVINSYLVGLQDEIFSTKANIWKCNLGAFNKEFYVLEKFYNI